MRKIVPLVPIPTVTLVGFEILGLLEGIDLPSNELIDQYKVKYLAILVPSPAEHFSIIFKQKRAKSQPITALLIKEYTTKRQNIYKFESSQLSTLVL